MEDFKPGDLVRLQERFWREGVTPTSERNLFVVNRLDTSNGKDDLYVDTLSGQPVRYVTWQKNWDNDWNPECWEKLSPFEVATTKIILGL